MNGGDPDPVGVAFQPEYLLVVLATIFQVNLILQPLRDCMLTFEQLAFGLQQFGQMQHVGQRALTLGRIGEQPRWNIEVGQQAMDHREYALMPPRIEQDLETLEFPFQAPLVVVEHIQLVRRPAEQPNGQRGPNATLVSGLCDGMQNQPQITRLLGVEDRIAVG